MPVTQIPLCEPNVSSLPTNDEADQPSPDSDTVRNRSTPGWVKVLGIIFLVLVLLFVVSRLIGIQHGPDLHSSLLDPLRLAFTADFNAA